MHHEHKARAYLIGHALKPYVCFALAAVLIVGVLVWRFF